MFAIYALRPVPLPFYLLAVLWFSGIHILFLSRVPFESFVVVIGWLPGFLVLSAVWSNKYAGIAFDRARRAAIYVDILAVVAVLSTLLGIMGIWVTRSWRTAPLVGTFYWHNQLAIFLVMLLIPLAIRVLMVRPRARVSYFLVILYLAVAFVMARSVGSLLALLISVAYLAMRLWAGGARKKLWLALLPVGMVFALLPFRALFAPYLVRVYDLLAGGHSVEARLEYWKACWNLFLEHPISGIGLGSFGFLFPRFQSSLATYSDDPHNLALQLLAESGLVGALLILGLLGWLFLRIARAKPMPEYVPLAFALEASFLSGVLHSLIDFDWKSPALVMTLFLVAGMRLWLEDSIVYQVPTGSLSRDRKRRNKRSRFRWVNNRTHAWRTLAWGIPAGALVLSWAFASPGIIRFRIYSENPDLRGTREAIILLKRPLHMFPWNSWLHYVIGRDSFKIDPADGRYYAERAVALNPFHPDYRLSIAAYLAHDGDLATAELEMQEALRLDPWNRPHIYRELAQLQMVRYNIEAAKTTLERAVSLYPFKTAEEAYSAKLEFRKMKANLVLADIHRLLADIYEAQRLPEKASEHRRVAQALEGPS
ncbi:MAG: O-antigen ligase family protein [bacterium JZ-2024 1]